MGHYEKNISKKYQIHCINTCELEYGKETTKTRSILQQM